MIDHKSAHPSPTDNIPELDQPTLDSIIKLIMLNGSLETQKKMLDGSGDIQDPTIIATAKAQLQQLIDQAYKSCNCMMCEYHMTARRISQQEAAEQRTKANIGGNHGSDK